MVADITHHEPYAMTSTRKPKQTSMALWTPTKALLDAIIQRQGQGARCKFWDLIARREAEKLGIPYRVNDQGIAEPVNGHAA